MNDILAVDDLRGSDHIVLPRLANVADRHPVLCLQVLEAWVIRLDPDNSRTGYLLATKRDAIDHILAAGRADPNAQDRISSIVSRLMRLGLDLRSTD